MFLKSFRKPHIEKHRLLIFGLAFLLSLSVQSGFCQSIAAANLNYWYDPLGEVRFRIKTVNGVDSIQVFYRLDLTGLADTSMYSMEWEKRDSYGQRKGEPLTAKAALLNASAKSITGKFMVAKPEKPWLAVALVKNKKTKENLLYFTQIEKSYPADGLCTVNSEIEFSAYVDSAAPCRLIGANPNLPLHLFWYKTKFPIASPPFAEKESKVDPIIKPDSVFLVSGSDELKLAPGMYLAQADTTATAGFCFYAAESPYPKYNQLEDLAPPLTYICTKEEHSELLNAGSDKTKFDKVILGITRDKERAKNFMRNYFRRIELANFYFTSYKEGWKTDRGMIYLIFGAPDEVNRAGDSEIWNYKNQRTRFTFVKSGSIYDPDNFALVRDKRFTETWYYTIDLWRKSRF